MPILLTSAVLSRPSCPPRCSLPRSLPQVPPALMQRTLSNPTGSSSFKLLKEVQAAGGVMRTVVAMKNTVMKIAVHNRQQVRGGGQRAASGGGELWRAGGQLGALAEGIMAERYH